MNPALPNLLRPIELSGVRLRNRVLMGSMHTGLEEESGAFPQLSAYFAARARGGVGLIVTGGFAPNLRGQLKPFAGTLASHREARRHRAITEAVHAEGGHIALQILHAGRYAYHPLSAAPSRLQAPINPFTPWALSRRGVAQTIDHFVRCAELAREAGYDGVEVMGSEGYLINQFLVAHTNKRSDEWGGSWENRKKFPIEIVRRIREACGPNFIVVYRLSMLDLVPDGSSWAEVLDLAKGIESAGASALNTGIGWHEARVPTIATAVPRGAFTWVTRRLREAGVVQIPLITSNRINTPELAESVLASGVADMVSMARPLLADPDFVKKASEGRSDRINTCIACNQACLDLVFQNKTATCLVNPQAARETRLVYTRAPRARRIAVVGAGPAGLSAACVAAERGHAVTLFEAQPQIGGQLDLARRVPGKEEFNETLRYFSNRLRDAGVDLRLSTRVDLASLQAGAFEEVVLAAGVRPRELDFPGADHPKVVSYPSVLRGEVTVGRRVAIIGAGGIGFDVAEMLREDTHEAPELGRWLAEWGVDMGTWGQDPAAPRGGLGRPNHPKSVRTLHMLQRKPTRPGLSLGKTTGWIHRARLQGVGVEFLSGVRYRKVDDLGLHIEVGGVGRVLEVDHVVVCAGQLSENGLLDGLQAAGVRAHLIGGARLAAELDALRAIHEGAALAASF